MHHWYETHGIRLAERDGWLVPEPPADPAWQPGAAGSGGLALADLSTWVKTSVRGAGIAPIVLYVLGDTPAARPRGVTTVAGHGPGMACRLTDDQLLLLTSSAGAHDLDWLLVNRQQPLPGEKTDETFAYAGLGLLGPQTDEVLRRLTALDLGSAGLPANSCAETALAGVHALVVRPLQLTVPAVAVFVSWDVGEYVWTCFLEAGRPLALTVVGPHVWEHAIHVRGDMD
jgi:4-methylaminobutanoate oxidase (formaldehyde-forming)